jgi:transposase
MQNVELPDNPAELKNILNLTVANYENKLLELKRAYIILEEKYKLLKDDHFGRKSEKKTDTDVLNTQVPLFNEAELGVDRLEEDALASLDKEEQEVLEEEKNALAGHLALKESRKKHSPKKGGKKPLPAHLPRINVVHDLPEDEKEGRPKIGEEIREELDIQVEFRVIRHVYPVYGEKRTGLASVENNLDVFPAVISAESPKRILPGSQFSENFIANVFVAKYNEGIPFYRQEQMLKVRHQLSVSRSRMCYWAIKLGPCFEELTGLMKQDAREGPLIQMDETRIQVLKEPDRKPTDLSWIWVLAGTNKQGKRILLFYYFRNRSSDVPLVLLEDYVGYLQTDGYKAYDSLSENPGLVQIGCFAHARRYFIKAEKVSKTKRSEKVALSFIRQIYFAEEKYRDLLNKGAITIQDFLEQRKEAVLVILKKFKKWLDAKKLTVTPKSKLGEAVAYTLGQWDKLCAFLETPFATPDNNFCENAIRPFVIGRKNWLFCDTPQGAYASAALYSLIETAKANNLDPHKYLAYVLKKYPQAKADGALINLLPYNLTNEQILAEI